MSRPLIRLGDKTSHGGVVIEATGSSHSGNVGFARVGDKVTCPQLGHGTCPIVTGDTTLIIDGKAAARDGDLTACGASLIASQQLTTDLV